MTSTIHSSSPAAESPSYQDDDYHDTPSAATSNIEALQRACAGPRGKPGMIVLWNHCVAANASMSYLLDRQQQEKKKPVKTVKGVVFHGCTFKSSGEESTPQLLKEFFLQQSQRDLPYVEISRGVIFESEKLIHQQDATRIILHALAETEGLSIQELRLSFVDLCDFAVGYELGRIFQSPTCKVRKLSLVCPSLDQNTMNGFLKAFDTTTSHGTTGLNEILEEMTIELEHGQDTLLDHLSQLLVKFSSLRKLNFIDTELSVASLPQFTKLIEQQPNLTSLDIIQSVDLFGGKTLSKESDDIVRSFAKAVGESRTLKCLSLCRSGLGKLAVGYLLQALTENTTLETLDLRVNGFCYCEEWAKYLPHLKHLTKLELPYANPSEYTMLTRYLRRNTSLQEFHCGVSTPNRGEIIALLKRNKLLSMAQRAEESKYKIPIAAWPLVYQQLSSNKEEASPVYSFLLATAPDIVSAFQTT